MDVYLPPWQQKIFSSIMADIGRQLKQSVKVFQSLMLYLLLPDGKTKVDKILLKEDIACL